MGADVDGGKAHQHEEGGDEGHEPAAVRANGQEQQDERHADMTAGEGGGGDDDAQTAPDPDPVITGNVDGNEVVDSGDVTYLVNHLLGQTPDNFVIEAADVNGDGEVDIADVAALTAAIMEQMGVQE